MTTKQTQTTATPEEKPTAELLLRRFKLMDEIVEDVRKKNIERGLDPKMMGYYIHYDSESGEKRRYNYWIAKVTNKRTGRFNQIKDLKARELIPEDEVNENDGKTYPYRRLNALIKVKTEDGKLWLHRIEQWVGIDAAGQEVTCPVVDLDYIRKPQIAYERILKDPTDPSGPSIRVGKIMTNHVWSVEQPGPKTYLNEYSREKVDQYLRYAVGPIDNHGKGTSLALKKEGVTNECSATYEQFVSEEDFDTVFERIRTPAPEFKDFLNDMKKQAKKAVDADQYR
jgi:hypothetical protein